MPDRTVLPPVKKQRLFGRGDPGLPHTYLSKVFFIDTEHEVQFSRVILQDPFQRVVIFAVLQ